MTTKRAIALMACVVLSLVVACSGGRSGGGGGDPAPSDGTVERALSAAIEEFWAADFKDAYKDVRGVAVSVDDEIVLETYFDNSRGQHAGVASVTKSVMSLLIGIAIDQGHIPGVDSTVSELLPERRDQMTPGVGGVTLAQLLTMTAGMLPDNLDGTTFYDATDDWIGTILAQELERAPGQAFAYASAGSHLLSAILVEATGQPVLDYARKHLFDPLDIDTTPAADLVFSAATPEDVAATRRAYDQADFVWPRDRQGYHIGDGFLKLRIEDMVRLGQLMLNGGQWQGEQVVSSGWVEESTRTHVNDTTTSVGPAASGYGYLWWTTTADTHPAYAAVGYGGQLVEVVPDLGLVVAISTHIPPPPAPPRTNGAALISLVDFVIAPAVEQ